MHGTSKLAVGVALPNVKYVTIVLNDETVTAECAATILRASRLAVRTRSAARTPTVNWIAAEIERSFFREESWAAPDTVLLRILRVAALRTCMNHVPQDQVSDFAVFWGNLATDEALDFICCGRRILA